MKRLSLRPLRRGFTLVELLVVIGIIAVLISILIPALKKAQQSAFRVRCMANERSLTQAWMTYSDDWKQRLIDPWPDRTNSGQYPWFLGNNWTGKVPTAPGGGKFGNTDDAIIYGSLYKYTRSVDLYHCQGDFGWHLVSYTINGQMNGERAGPNPTPFVKRSQIRRPAEVFVFIEENDLRNNAIGYNQGSFMVPITGPSWIDYPGAWHSGGVNLSFADGHVEYWVWKDPATAKLGATAQNNLSTSDLKRVQLVTIPQGGL